MKSMQVLMLVIVTIVLIVIIPLSFVLYSINQTALKPYATDEYITKIELYEVLSDNIQERFADINHPLKDQYEELFQSTLQDALDEVMTRSWVNDKVDEMQKNVWDYLLGVTESVEAVHITELKEAIILEFQLVLEEQGYPEEQANRVVGEIESQMPEVLYINDVLPLTKERTVQAKNVYQQAQQGYDVILLLSVILFILGLLLTFYPKALMRWSGFVLGIIGVLTFLTLFLLRKRNIEASIQASGASETSEWEHGLSTLTSTLFMDIVEIINPMALILVVVGILLVLFSFLPLVHRIDVKIRNQSAWQWVRAVLAVLIFTVAGWQIYQLAMHTNALW
jgi:protein-S-isoprenylcysteine O-methyltransferase Ste14